MMLKIKTAVLLKHYKLCNKFLFYVDQDYRTDEAKAPVRSVIYCKLLSRSQQTPNIPSRAIIIKWQYILLNYKALSL